MSWTQEWSWSYPSFVSCMVTHMSDVECVLLGSDRSQEVNFGRTWKSREKRGHHDVPAGSEECPASRRHPTPFEVHRDWIRARQPPRRHHTPEIWCPFHNWWGKFSKNICNLHKRKKKACIITSQMQTSLKSPYFPSQTKNLFFPV